MILKENYYYFSFFFQQINKGIRFTTEQLENTQRYDGRGPTKIGDSCAKKKEKKEAHFGFWWSVEGEVGAPWPPPPPPPPPPGLS